MQHFVRSFAFACAAGVSFTLGEATSPKSRQIDLLLGCSGFFLEVSLAHFPHFQQTTGALQSCKLWDFPQRSAPMSSGAGPSAGPGAGPSGRRAVGPSGRRAVGPSGRRAVGPSGRPGLEAAEHRGGPSRRRGGGWRGRRAARLRLRT